MKTFTCFVLCVLVSCAFSLSMDASGDMEAVERQRRCGKVSVTIRQTTISCPLRKKTGRIATITATIRVGATRQVAVIKTVCVRPNAIDRIVRRISSCLRVLLPRCRCLAPERRPACIVEQTELCAGRNNVTFVIPLPPTPDS